jgi:hypothetical protein
MGLSVVVGSLAEALDEDYSVEGLRAVFEAINGALSKSGLPAHIEPESLPALPGHGSVNGFPYSCLHYLRRAYAYRVKYPDLPLPQPADGEDPAEDPIIEQVATPEHHLLWHSDCEGYYVPIDFETVIEDDDVPGACLTLASGCFKNSYWSLPHSVSLSKARP